MNKTIILNADSYKASQWVQYPEKTTHVYSYIESRGSKVSDYTVFFGLQMFLKEYLSKPITLKDIDAAEMIIKAHGEPFNREGWEYIVTKHNGFLPLIIKAAPEGSVINNGNILVSVENTDPQCYWLTSYIETAILRGIWYPTTVATISHVAKQHIKKYLEKTADDTSSLPFKLHDFGMRGVSSFESGGIGGLAHLVNFMGTDTMSALLYANEYYNHVGPAGFSIPASEHSTITSWGRDNEVKAYQNMINKFGSGDIFACVSDSYDIFNAVENLWGGVLQDQVKHQNAVLVVRPDSGEPAEVVVKCMELLEKRFGCTINSKGYKVLNKVRVIQGDGITIDTIPVILEAVSSAGFSTDNLAMGMGGGLLQHCNRDTYKFAMKCSAAVVDGRVVDVYKDPITDSGKKSKTGYMSLLKNDDGTYRTIKNIPYTKEDDDVLQIVYHNGRIIKETTLEEVRRRSEEK